MDWKNMISITNGNALPFPSKCLVCGNAQRDCVNFPVTQQWNGALLICVECFRSVGINHPELGLVDKSSWLEVVEAKRELSERLVRFDGAIGIFRSRFAETVDDFNHLLDDDSTVKPGFNGLDSMAFVTHDTGKR